MPVRGKVETYAHALSLIGLPLDGKIKTIIQGLETEGHTEKSICYSIWKGQDKLNQYRNHPKFWSILKNEILKYSWPKGDPRWDEYWKKKREEEKAKELEKAERAKRAQAEDYSRRYPGFIYFVQGESGGSVKIGYATDIEKRIKSLQTGFPETLVILKSFPGDTTDEASIHEEFKEYRLRGEWFKPDVLELADMTAEKVRKRTKPKICKRCGGSLIAIKQGEYGEVVGVACTKCGYLV